MGKDKKSKLTEREKWIEEKNRNLARELFLLLAGMENRWKFYSSFYHNKKSQYTHISLKLPTALGAEKDELRFLKKRPCVLCKAQLGNDSIPEADTGAAAEQTEESLLRSGRNCSFLVNFRGSTLGLKHKGLRTEPIIYGQCFIHMGILRVGSDWKKKILKQNKTKQNQTCNFEMSLF